MEYPTGIIDLVLSLGAGASGWFGKTLYAAIQTMQKDIADFKVKVAEDYTPTNRFEDAVKGLDGKLDKILDRLNEKADK